jgi:tRNA-splicing ligase RtcB
MRTCEYWCNDIDEGAQKQISNISSLPFVENLAIMPDCHVGYGVPIGSVVATSPDVVIPNAVGVDIGCGMLACDTGLANSIAEDQELLKKWVAQVKRDIPVGKIWHKDKQVNNISDWYPNYGPVVETELEKASYQLGTLGGGNHFIEFQAGSNGNLWIMIHSGSRNVGYQVAGHYHWLARDMNKRWYSNVDEEGQLAFLPTESDVGKDYLLDMKWCVKFAKSNRAFMMYKILKSIDMNPDEFEHIKYVSTNHNFARLENHMSKNVMVHRKGAIHAKRDEMHVIPGSMGTNSYIVKGLGGKLALESASHGAGRPMSRAKAKETLDLKEQQDLMAGIVHDMNSNDKLDEAPGAYKDIDEVMEQQKDLVEIVTTLRPVASIKG